MQLERRVRRLESRCLPKQDPPLSAPPIDAEAFFRRLRDEREEALRREKLRLWITAA
jgi:hypothetical protein